MADNDYTATVTFNDGSTKQFVVSNHKNDGGAYELKRADGGGWVRFDAGEYKSVDFSA